RAHAGTAEALQAVVGDSSRKARSTGSGTARGPPKPSSRTSGTRSQGPRERGPAGRRMQREEHRRPRGLGEVEVREEVPQDPGALANVGPGVRPPVGPRVEALAAQEVVLDELQVRVEREDLVIDVASLRVGADHDPRHAEAV